MKKIYLILTALAIAVFIFSGCKKDLYSPATKSVGDKISNSNLSGNLSADDSTMVITPFGLRHKSDVHIIAAGHQLKYNGDHLIEVDQRGKLAHDFGVQAPLAYLANLKNNTSNHSISSSGKIIPGSPYANWDTWALGTETKQNSFTSFETSWIVPTNPTNSNDNQTLFIFPGVQDVTGAYLLQPVLQWGPSAAGGGKNWAVDNWFVSCSNCAVFGGVAIPVTEGTSLTGTMTKSGSAGNYTYSSSFGSLYSANNLTMPSTVLLNNFVETLETYGVTSAGDYPPDLLVKMTGIGAGAGNPVENFVAHNQNTTYGQHTIVVNSGEVDIYFRNPLPPPPAITYSTPDGYNANVPIPPLSPTNTGGAATSYAVSPALPAGLTLNTTTGVISGTPTIATPAANYTITATNAGGSGTAVINITINPPTISVTFDINSSNPTVDDFMLFVDGLNISGPRGVSQSSGTAVVPDNTLSPDGNATVVMQITFGPMPTSATLYNSGAPINGVISGSNITFSHVNASVAVTFTININ